MNNCGPVLSDTWVLTHANGLGGTPEWGQLPLTLTLAAHFAAYDPLTNRMIVFGGHLGVKRSDRNEVKILLDANGIGDPAWITLTPTGTLPPPRGEVTAGAYDP